MSKVIERTVKVLTEFESQLDEAKAGADEARKRMLKNAGEWAESARAAAVGKAQRIATDATEKAREEAMKEAESIKRKGQTALKAFEDSMSRRKAKAVEVAESWLLGESK